MRKFTEHRSARASLPPQRGRDGTLLDVSITDGRATMTPETAKSEEILEALPFGVIVTDGTGAIVSRNPAVADILGYEHLSGAERCCDIVGCRQPGGVLEHGCLTELALESAGPVPEVRMDLADPTPPGAVWVTASRLRDESGGVVLHLRPGDKHDRRRRTDPHWTGRTELRITVLGRTSVSSAESSLDGRWLEQRAGQLLKLLVAERRRVLHAEEIATVLWPDSGRAALNNVRYAIHALRDRIEPRRRRRAPSSFIVAAHGGYALDRSRVRIDADDFEDVVADGLRAQAQGRDDDAIASLRRAIALYGGDFLEEEPYAEWALEERERLRALAARGGRALLGLLRARGENELGLACARWVSELDRFDTDVQRDLIELCVAQGRRSEAKRRYGVLRARMLQEFGMEPEFSLGDVLDDIRSQTRS